MICILAGIVSAGDELAEKFINPPASARPWVYWFPLSGNLTREGITADFEAMARVGIGGVLYMEVDQGAPKGKADFVGPLWREMFQHACKEANRLGLEINMNNDAGWCGSGGPWITPELSMQVVVWTKTNIVGKQEFDAVLPLPKANKNYYRDIALFAYPTPSTNYVIPGIKGKSSAVRQEVPLRVTFPAISIDAVTGRDSIVDLTSKLGKDGRLSWKVPEGSWTLLRMGCTTTGKDNHPAPESGRGLECDKLSREAMDVHFNGLMKKVIDDNKSLAGKTLISTHIDSWETHSQNWTPGFRKEFRDRRGYDPWLWLPVMTGLVVDGLEVSERFLWDVRMTIAEMLYDNYAERLRKLARRHGVRLSIEAYGDGPYDNLTYSGRADEPMGEFWAWSKFGAANSCTEMSSGAHVYGKKILGAEAFTATDKEKWQGHPANIKDLGDWAFCEGINRFVFHRYATQPWVNPDYAPGMSMGPWGLHYERTQTWWEQSRAWHEYLSRCQFILQQGLFVADLCFLEPESSPQDFRSPVKSGHDRPGYNFDGCPPEVVLTRMSVKDGRLVLPDGMNYRMLVLPRVEVMTPRLLEKIRDLVKAGATVLGNPPVKAPTLEDYPKCDERVKVLARELWGDGAMPEKLTERRFGKGRLIWGHEILQKHDADFDGVTTFALSTWIWFPEGKPASSAPPGKRYFRRIVNVDGPVKSAKLVMTADNTFECWVNGRVAGKGEHFNQAYAMNVGSMLKQGVNVIAVMAENTLDTPNPAGLVGSFTVVYRDGRKLEIQTDENWESSKVDQGAWKTNTASLDGWSKAIVLGPMGMPPWHEVEESLASVDTTLEIGIPCRLLSEMGIPPDFECEPENLSRSLRYIHKRIGEADVYFVANKEQMPKEQICSFRVRGKVPELWWPDSGRIRKAAVYEEVNGRTRLPIHFEPSGSVFVIFREPVKLFDQAVSLTHNGIPLLPVTMQKTKATVQKAVYGILDDSARTRDVTGKVRGMIEKGDLSIRVTDMAKGDDPAYGEVKTLRVEYLAGGQLFSVSGTDGSTVSLNLPAPEPAAEIYCADGKLRLEARQTGSYELKTASGRILHAEVKSVPVPLEIAGSWDVIFDPKRGGPSGVVKFARLEDWSKRQEEGIRYYSGTATYRKVFDLAKLPIDDCRLPNEGKSSDKSEIGNRKSKIYLDLGQVAVMAEVKLNGRDLGILWKPPYRVEVTDAIKQGENTLEIKVVNLWINRQIGDEQLLEDSDRNKNGTLKSWPQWVTEGKPSPAGRYSFTSWRLWKKGDPLVESGLIGPVILQCSQRLEIK